MKLSNLYLLLGASLVTATPIDPDEGLIKRDLATAHRLTTGTTTILLPRLTTLTSVFETTGPFIQTKTITSYYGTISESLFTALQTYERTDTYVTTEHVTEIYSVATTEQSLEAKTSTVTNIIPSISTIPLLETIEVPTNIVTDIISIGETVVPFTSTGTVFTTFETKSLATSTVTSTFTETVDGVVTIGITTLYPVETSVHTIISSTESVATGDTESEFTITKPTTIETTLTQLSTIGMTTETNDGLETITITDYITHLISTTTIFHSDKVNTIELLSTSTIVSAGNISTLYFTMDFVTYDTDLFTVIATGNTTQEIPMTVTDTVLQITTGTINYVTDNSVSNTTKPTPIGPSHSNNSTSSRNRSTKSTTVINGKTTITVVCDQYTETGFSKPVVSGVQTTVADKNRSTIIVATTPTTTKSNGYIYRYEGVGNSLAISLSPSVLFLISLLFL
ncbi:hypothetical protein C6P45_000585 [Maudiozyma exigua]|uniref:Uncharacterized protein n=1 Tax=Maudiozyma exigua TaxID=34358 RepID=A0A9P6WFS1_MAUEX|nr:hypothetical protein C6P45_000585 [Kazachstania exigua]